MEKNNINMRTFTAFFDPERTEHLIVSLGDQIISVKEANNPLVEGYMVEIRMESEKDMLRLWHSGVHFGSRI
jgi:hypothetical protein